MIENEPEQLTADDYLAIRFANKMVDLISNGYEIEFKREGTETRVELSKITHADLSARLSVENTTIKCGRLLRIVEDLEADLLKKIEIINKSTIKWKQIKRSRR